MFRLFLFLAGTMAIAPSTAWGVSQCPAESVPIQIVNQSGESPPSILSAVKTPDSSLGRIHTFRSIITAVTEHVATRLEKEKLCIDSTDSKNRSLLQFVNWPLGVRDTEYPPHPVLSLDARPSNGCRVSSPWVDLVYERTPVPSIRGIVRWNARQLLVDQALLAGASNVPTGLAMPYKSKEVGAFAKDYEDSEHLGKDTSLPIEERIPPDLLWLFRRSIAWGVESFYMDTRGAIHVVAAKNAENYTRLVIAMIDRCFDSGERDIRYNSILDATDLIAPEQYKIQEIYNFMARERKMK